MSESHVQFGAERHRDQVTDPPPPDERSGPAWCPKCHHRAADHEASVEDEFAIAHGGAGYAFCRELVRRGESATICACRVPIGGPARQHALWPVERPPIATFPAPGAPLTMVRLVSTEVTTTDPLNGQPDFEEIEITYLPDRRLIDTKSLKAYWLWWRGRGASMERLATLVATDISDATEAHRIEVIVREAPRGGIAIHATACIERDIVRDPRHSAG